MISLILHSGTSQYGHYYSIINYRKINKCYVCNDTEINNYDINQLNEDVFGGNKDFPNACMLFNEKDNKENC